MKVAIITANTDIYKGTKANESGEAVKLVAEEAGLEVVFMRALPLDRSIVRNYETFGRWKSSRPDPYHRWSRVQSGRLYTGSNDGYCRKTGSGNPGSNAGTYNEAHQTQYAE